MAEEEGLVLVCLWLLWLQRECARGCRSLKDFRGHRPWLGRQGLQLLSSPKLLALPLDGSDPLTHSPGHRLVISLTDQAQGHLEMGDKETWDPL